jgi:hypothetical protein
VDETGDKVTHRPSTVDQQVIPRLRAQSLAVKALIQMDKYFDPRYPQALLQYYCNNNQDLNP